MSDNQLAEVQRYVNSLEGIVVALLHKLNNEVSVTDEELALLGSQDNELDVETIEGGIVIRMKSIGL